MKTQINLIIGLFVIVLLSSCGKDQIRIDPSSNITSTTHDIVDFTEVRLSSEFNAIVSFSETEESVVIEANENLQEFITVEEKGGALVIGFKKNLNITGNSTLNVKIVTREVNDFSATGESTFTVLDKITSDRVNVDLTGESSFTAELASKDLTFDITGDSKIDLTGTVDNVDAKLTGESDMTDYDFTCKALDINLTGESKAQMTVTETIRVTASGESQLFYKGDASIEKQTTTGNSKVEKK